MNSCSLSSTAAEGQVLYLWLGLRVARKFRVGLFGYLKFRVLKIDTRNLPEINKTRYFGYPKIRVRVRVIPELPDIKRADKGGASAAL